MTISLDFTNPQLLVARISDTVNRHDADTQKQIVIDHIARHGAFKVLLILEDSFTSIDAFSDWSDTSEDEVIQSHVQQFAIVGNEKWQDHALLFFLSGVLPISIKFFKHDQEDFARAWLGDANYYTAAE